MKHMHMLSGEDIDCDEKALAITSENQPVVGAKLEVILKIKLVYCPKIWDLLENIPEVRHLDFGVDGFESS